MERYARQYDRYAELGWTGGGRYAGPGYRTSGYRVQRQPERSAPYDREVVRHRPRGTPLRRGYEWLIQPRGLPAPRYGPRRPGRPRPGYAADDYGGGYGPGYYSQGFYGRELGRGRNR